MNEGEIKRGRDIGKPNFAHHKYIWCVCSKCKKGRWVYLYNFKRSKGELLCKDCNGRIQGKRNRDKFWRGSI